MYCFSLLNKKLNNNIYTRKTDIYIYIYICFSQTQQYFTIYFTGNKFLSSDRHQADIK